MATVRIPIETFTERRLPSVCARTGVVARDQYLVAARGTDRTDGPLLGAIPLSSRVANTISRIRRVAVFLFFISIAVISVALGTRSAIIGTIASLLLMVAIGLLLTISKNTVRATFDGEGVMLERVHPAFVDAVTKPRKCDDCSGAGQCAVTEMHACEGANR